MKTIASFIFILVLGMTSHAQMKLDGNYLCSNKENVGDVYKAFDGNLNTSYKAKSRSYSWVGIEFDTTYVISSVKWARIKNGAQKSTQLAVFEGANRADFADAIPIYMIKSDMAGELNSADVDVTRAFRYVRYVGPDGSYCQISELEFYGYPGEGSDSLFYQPTNLPLVAIQVDDGSDPVDKVNELKAHFTVVSNDGLMSVSDTGTVRLRGNTSIQWEKKPYRMKFANKTSLLGSPSKAKKWVLINSWDDKSLIRNNLAFELSRRAGLEYTPFCTPVDVIFNGSYRGTYDLADQIDQHKNRVNVESLANDVVDGEDLTGGYIIENDGNCFSEENWFKTNNSNYITIKYPDEDDINEVQKNYITDHFKKMEDLLYAKDFSSDGYRKYFDLESFLRYFIVEEFSGNPDAFWSTYFYKHRGDDRFYTGPVWDFNLAFDNDLRYYPMCWADVVDSSGNRIGEERNPDWLYSWNGNGEGLCAGNMSSFVSLIIDGDPESVNSLKDMWPRLRSTGGFDINSLCDYVDQQVALIDESQKLNFTRWNILNQLCYHNPTVRGSFEAEVDFVKSYLSERLEWMDWKLGCVDTTMTISVAEPGWATVYLPMAFQIPDNMSVYSIVGLEDGRLLYDTITAPEANTPYLIQAPQGEYALTGYMTKIIDTRSSGLLTGTATETICPVGSYVLQYLNGAVGFYYTPKESVIKVPANKAYLTLNREMANTPPRYFTIEDSATPLSTLTTPTSDKIYVYSIAGNLLLMIDKGSISGSVENHIINTLGQGIYVINDDNNYRKIVTIR